VQPKVHKIIYFLKSKLQVDYDLGIKSTILTLKKYFEDKNRPSVTLNLLQKRKS
jgi:hypothetical protein